VDEEALCLRGGTGCGVLLLLVNLVFQDSVADTWFWKLDPLHDYTVKGVYHLLTYGLRVSHPKCLYLCGDCWIKDFQLKITWLDATFFLQGLNFARVVMVWRNQWITCSWIVISLGKFGILFWGRWEFIMCFHFTLLCIRCNFVATIFSEKMYVYAFKLFGWQGHELFGRNIV